MTTELEVQVEKVRDFLALPVEALPQAYFLRQVDEDDGMDAWSLLREFVADPDGCMRWEAPIMLRADRDEWRDGVTITI